MYIPYALSKVCSETRLLDIWLWVTTIKKWMQSMSPTAINPYIGNSEGHRQPIYLVG